MRAPIDCWMSCFGALLEQFVAMLSAAITAMRSMRRSCGVADFAHFAVEEFAEANNSSRSSSGR